MESVETMSEGEWNSSFNGMIMCSNDEADFMAQLLGNCSIPPNLSINADESTMYFSLDEANTNSMYSSSSYASHETYCPSSSFSDDQNIFVGNKNLMGMDYYVMDGKNTSDESTFLLNQDVSNDSTDLPEDVFLDQPKEEKETPSEEDNGKSKKRPRIPNGEFQRCKRSMKLKKCTDVDNQNVEDNNNNNNNSMMSMALQRQSSSGCFSEDESNASHELSGLSSKKGKARAGRGSATDPQSLYARKRRERINERLKILQSLVPNGTKVDISTMLEEAVQYVKFLQLQIKLLSSEDMWMYAPIAYNGMGIGLDIRTSTPKSQSS